MPGYRTRGFVVSNPDGAPSRALPSSASIALADTDRGFLPNRLTTDQRDAISDPRSGLLIYNTDTLGFEYYNGSIWKSIGDDGLITSGTITEPVAYIDLTLPDGYSYFELQMVGFQFDNSNGLSFLFKYLDAIDSGTNDYFTFGSFDTGNTFSGSANQGQFGWVGGSEVASSIITAIIDPGTATRHASVVSTTFGTWSDSVDSNAFEINRSFINPEASIDRVQMIRIGPWFGDEDNLIAGTYSLWGRV